MKSTRRVRSLLLALPLLLLLGATSASAEKKVIVLGFDGADPETAQEMMDAGKLPNLARLAEQGVFSDLATTNPAESPVSWASFATSQGPGHHGIFDFLRRVPGTYFPEIALASASSRPLLPSPALRASIVFAFGAIVFLVVFFTLKLLRQKRSLALGLGILLALPGWVLGSIAMTQWIPEELPLPVLNRQGTPFWDYVAEGGKRVTAIDIPVTFPALAADGVQLTTALGTPDIRQTWGNWSLYSTQEFDAPYSETAGNLKHVGEDGGTTLRGPANFMDPDRAEIDLDIRFTRTSDDRMRVEVQGQSVELEVGEWSDFVRLRFQINPLLKIVGTTRFKLMELEPEWSVYQEPLNFDPYHLPPTVNISSPRGFAKDLADRYGLRETLGWSIATNPLKDEAIDYGTFVEDLEFTLTNRRRVMFGELERGDWDLFVGVFMFTDRMQHMMYRATDREHPYFSEELNAQFGDRVSWAYEEMDRIVGEVAERFVDDDTMLMIVSDHGFHTFRRGVNLNTWLVKNGFMALKGQGLADADGNYQRLEDFLDPNGRFFKNVDWSRTQAYCLGLGSMFINLRGRERQGAVNPSEYEDVRDAIIKGLLELEDPEHLDQRVVINVYKREDIFQGPNLPVAPDLFVGFDNPYRVSWQTAAGGIPPQIFEDNLNNWSGDHCSVAPDITGGIFFANRSLPEGRRSIMDIGPTVLQALGLEVPGGLDGRSLLNAPADAR